MNRSWTIHESSVNLSWINHGWGPGVPAGVLVASPIMVESILNHSWNILLAIMNQSIRNKSFLNQSWIIYKSIMNHSWIIRESLMNRSWIIQESSIHHLINHSFRNHSGIIQKPFINHQGSNTDSILLLAVAPWCLDGVPVSVPLISFHVLSFVYLCFRTDNDDRLVHVHVCACVCMCMCMCMVIWSCACACVRIYPYTGVHAHVCACTHAPHLNRDGFR